MQHESSVSGTWRALSNESASAIEKAGRAVVAVHARRRIPASGVHWRPGIVVTADHTLERDEEITITLPDGRTAAATLAGRDPTTDLAILKLEGLDLQVAEIGDIAALKVGHWVLAAGRTSEGGSRASLALVRSGARARDQHVCVVPVRSGGDTRLDGRTRIRRARKEGAHRARLSRRWHAARPAAAEASRIAEATERDRNHDCGSRAREPRRQGGRDARRRARGAGRESHTRH